MERIPVTVRLFPYLSPPSTISVPLLFHLLCGKFYSNFGDKLVNKHQIYLHFISLQNRIWLCNALMFEEVALQHTVMGCSGAN